MSTEYTLASGTGWWLNKDLADGAVYLHTVHVEPIDCCGTHAVEIPEEAIKAIKDML